LRSCKELDGAILFIVGGGTSIRRGAKPATFATLTLDIVFCETRLEVAVFDGPPSVEDLSPPLSFCIGDRTLFFSLLFEVVVEELVAPWLEARVLLFESFLFLIAGVINRPLVQIGCPDDVLFDGIGLGVDEDEPFLANRPPVPLVLG